MPRRAQCSWVLAALVCSPALASAAGPVAACDPAGLDLCGFDRPEDLAASPDSRWMLVSTASAREPLVLVDLQGNQRIAALPYRSASRTAGDRNCVDAPQRWDAGGNDMRKIAGQRRIAVLNRDDGGRADASARIELLSLRERDGATRWIGCIHVPARYALNDVALGPRGELYASHMFDRPQSDAEALALREAFLAAAPTGRAIVWRQSSGWTDVPETEMSFANGVAISADGHWLAVAGTYSQAIVLVPLGGGAARRIPVPLQPDNLTRAGRAGFLVAGHTGVPVSGIDPCRSPARAPCGFPFAISQLQPSGAVEAVFLDDGADIPGASVAVRVGRRLFLGSAFGDRISVIQLDR